MRTHMNGAAKPLPTPTRAPPPSSQQWHCSSREDDRQEHHDRITKRNSLHCSTHKVPSVDSFTMATSSTHGRMHGGAAGAGGGAVGAAMERLRRRYEHMCILTEPSEWPKVAPPPPPHAPRQPASTSSAAAPRARAPIVAVPLSSQECAAVMGARLLAFIDAVSAGACQEHRNGVPYRLATPSASVRGTLHHLRQHHAHRLRTVQQCQRWPRRASVLFCTELFLFPCVPQPQMYRAL